MFCLRLIDKQKYMIIIINQSSSINYMDFSLKFESSSTYNTHWLILEPDSLHIANWFFKN